MHHTALFALVILRVWAVLLSWTIYLAVTLKRGTLKKEFPPVFLKGIEFRKIDAFVPSVKLSDS